MSPRTSPLPTRRDALLSFAAAGLALSGCGAPSTPPAATATPRSPAARGAARGVAWLLAHQGAEGRFGSATYGFLAGGRSLTPFVLDALLDAAELVPDAVPAAAISAGMAAVSAMVDDGGAIGFGPPALDYPVYATALALRCLGRLRPAGWEAAAAPLVGFLRGQQFAGAPWRAHPALGGFGMGSRPLPEAPYAGHVDLSMTRRALEGLRAVDVPEGDPCFRLAARFVARCQAEDGGYLYSPVELALNKGARDGDTLRSYGSATADGLLASLAIRAPTPGAPLAPQAQRALDHLRTIHAVDQNPGVSGGVVPGFAPAMVGYYRAASARVFEALGGPSGGDWRAELEAAVLGDQHEDGRWQNANPLQKEDDPLIATAFALRALRFAGRA